MTYKPTAEDRKRDALIIWCARAYLLDLSTLLFDLRRRMAPDLAPMIDDLRNKAELIAAHLEVRYGATNPDAQATQPPDEAAT